MAMHAKGHDVLLVVAVVVVVVVVVVVIVGIIDVNLMLYLLVRMALVDEPVGELVLPDLILVSVASY